MQRLARSFATVLSIISLVSVSACNDKQGDTKADAGKSADAGKAAADAGSDKTEAGADKAEAGAGEVGAAEAGAAEAGAGAGEVGAGDEGAAETGTGETGGADSTDGGGETSADGGETGEDSPIPALFESVKSLETDDDTAMKALADALAAGAAKLDAAKVAEKRGEALMTKGESERAETFFIWARDNHKVYADPVYNLAKLAAYAGDLELAKEHLAELQKRGNKKLMRKVGIEPAFAPLHDDPDVRKIYER